MNSTVIMPRRYNPSEILKHAMLTSIKGFVYIYICPPFLSTVCSTTWKFIENR